MLKALYARTIWLIFISFSLIVLAAGFFKFWQPQQETTSNKVSVYNAYVLEVNKASAAVKKKKVAVEAIKAAEAAWLPYVATKTPPQDVRSGGINVNVNPYQLLLDTKTFRDSVQTALNAQLKKGGVKVMVGPRINGITDQDAPNSILASYYNYPSAPFPVVIYDLGQVTVQGTYEQILENVRAWSSMPQYLAVAHNLALAGTAPRLTGTYDLSLVGYIRYDGVHAPIPDSGAAATAGAPAGGGFAGSQRGGRPSGAGAPTPPVGGEK